MPKDIQLKKAHRDVFADQDSSWMALDLPEIKPPIYSKAFILFLSGFLVTAVIYSSVTEVPVVVESTGKLATMRPAVPIRASTNFTIDTLMVKENQVVKPDTVLVASADGFKPEELKMVVELGKELQYINQQQPLTQCNNCFPAVQKALQISQRLSRRRLAAQVLKPVIEGVEGLGQAILQLKVVDDRLAGSRQRLAQLTGANTSGRMPASNANMMMAPAAGPHKAEIQKLQNQIVQQYAPYVEQIQKVRSNLINNTKTVAGNLDEMTKLTGVRAPFEGKIVNIRVKGAGEMVGGGQQLMEIVPVDNRIVAYIEVLNKDIGSIHVGDEVEVSVDAYPEMDYGVLKGHIHEILPVEANEQPGMYPGQDRGFKVRVILASQELQAGGQTFALLPGMTVRARTMKKQETLLKTFYRSIFRIKEDIRVRS